MNTEKLPFSYRLALAAVIVAGIFTRVWRLGDKILWLDEGIMWRMARKSIPEILDYYRLEQHSPLPQLLDHFWVKIAGDSVFALHLEPVLWSVLALLVFSATVFKHFPPRAALAAAAAFSLSALLPEFAQNFRYQALGTFFASVWLAAFLDYRAKGGAAWLLLYAAAVALFAQTHLYTLFTIISLSAYIVIFHGEYRGKVIPLLIANCVAAAGMAPKIIQIGAMGVSGKNPGIPLHAVMGHLMQVPVGGIVKIFHAFFAGRYVEPEELHPALFAALVAAFGGVILLSFFRRGLKSEAWMCAIVAGGTIFIGWLGMLLRGTPFSAMYFVPLSLFFSLMLGIGADRAAQWKPALLPIMLVLYAAVSFSFLGCYWKNLDRPENQRSLLEYVAENERPGDFLNISPPYLSTFDYYWRGGIPARVFFGDHNPRNAPHNNYLFLHADEFQLDEKKMIKWHSEVASHYRRVWMFWMLGAKNTEDNAGFARRWMDSHYTRLETRPYRMFPYSRHFDGEMTLYEIRPLDVCGLIRAR